MFAGGSRINCAQLCRASSDPCSVFAHFAQACLVLLEGFLATTSSIPEAIYLTARSGVGGGYSISNQMRNHEAHLQVDEPAERACAGQEQEHQQ